MPPRAKTAPRGLSEEEDASDSPAGGPAGPSSAGASVPTDPHTPARSSGRPRRSAAKAIDYSALIAPGDEDGDDDDEDAEPEQESEEESDDSLGSSVHASRPAKGKGRGAARGSGGRKAARLEMMDLNDDDNNDADVTGEDSEEEHTARRSALKGKKKATATFSKAPASSPAIKSRRGPRPSAAKQSKGHYAHHDVRPLYLSGPSGSGLLQIDEILPLDQIGKRAPRLRQLRTIEAQEERVRRHRVCWGGNDHYMRVNDESMAGTDWAWFPGKDTDLQSERRQRQKVKEYWEKRRADEAIGEQELQEIQRVGGIVIVDQKSHLKVLTHA